MSTALTLTTYRPAWLRIPLARFAYTRYVKWRLDWAKAQRDHHEAVLNHLCLQLDLDDRSIAALEVELTLARND